MDPYDPDVAPDPAAWFELGEGDRLDLVTEYHAQAGEKLPKRRLHAVIHAIVENQLAMDYRPAVEALAGLRAEGLGRHEAIHAIGAVLAGSIFTRFRGDVPAADEPDYETELRALTVAVWHERYGAPD